MMMTAPAMRASRVLYCASTCPTSVEIAPSVMKTMLKPMMNAAELSITLRKSWPSFIFNCSTPTPEIRETYPGTSGSTQGERNEISPATKAANGSGRVDIFSYCSEGSNVCTGILLDAFRKVGLSHTYRTAYRAAGFCGRGADSGRFGDAADAPGDTVWGTSVRALRMKPDGMVAVRIVRSPACSTFRLSKNVFTSGSVPDEPMLPSAA